MSRFESWGQMYLEAMASSLPIISARNIGSESIIQDDFGYLIPQEDYFALSERIISLLDNPDMIKMFGDRARLKAEKKYDWVKVIIPKYIEIYKNLPVPINTQ
jgi:phosphatidylinositol alpha-1,6-mannosyltransferase